MLEDGAALAEFKKILADHGATISALSCHGNALHPDKARAQRTRSEPQDYSCWRRSWAFSWCRFFGVSGRFTSCHRSQLGDLPVASGISESARLGKWNEVVAPYWTQHAKVRRRHGVKIAIEMHPGFVVYSPETMLRLRSIAGNERGVQLRSQPSFLAEHDSHCGPARTRRRHLHVHAKDTQIYVANLPRTGVLDTKLYTEERGRAWIFRTCGYGHGAEWWSEFISTLRMFGYDNVLSIEHEDSLLSPEEGLTKAANFSTA